MKNIELLRLVRGRLATSKRGRVTLLSDTEYALVSLVRAMHLAGCPLRKAWLSSVELLLRSEPKQKKGKRGK